MSRKRTLKLVVFGSLLILAALSALSPWTLGAGPKKKRSQDDDKVIRTDAEWRSLLTEEQFRVTRRKGTERAWTGAYWKTKTDGVYQCVGCGLPLFDSQAKYDSGTGWPSFWQPIGLDAVTYRRDRSRGELRTEVLCRRCDAHLGHVFSDGPQPTGLRFCMNSAALKLADRTTTSATESKPASGSE